MLGHNCLKSIEVVYGSTKQLSFQLDHLLSKHQGVFEEGMNTMKDVQAR